MTDELSELRKHVRWLEDERRKGVTVEDRLNEIDDRLDEINDNLTNLANAHNGVIAAFNRIADGLIALAPKSPPPPNPASDTPEEFFKAPNGRKKRPAKPKPRKSKLLIVPKDSDDRPETAS